jgi:hypothetical protein
MQLLLKMRKENKTVTNFYIIFFLSWDLAKVMELKRKIESETKLYTLYFSFKRNYVRSEEKRNPKS